MTAKNKTSHLALILFLLLTPHILHSEESISLSGFSHNNPFIDGTYSGYLGFSKMQIPKAHFKQSGNTVNGWIMITNDDFVAKQFVKGKIIYDISSSVRDSFRFVKVNFSGTHIKYIYISDTYRNRLNLENPPSIIRHFTFSNFSWNNLTMSTDLLANIPCSGIDPAFPQTYYPLTGNLILTKGSCTDLRPQDPSMSVFARIFILNSTFGRQLRLTK